MLNISNTQSSFLTNFFPEVSSELLLFYKNLKKYLKKVSAVFEIQFFKCKFFIFFSFLNFLYKYTDRYILHNEVLNKYYLKNYLQRSVFHKYIQWVTETNIFNG